MTVKLHRVRAGHYRTTVRVKGFHTDPVEVEVFGPDPHYPTDPHYRWNVEGVDDDRFFATLADARDYLNRFFEPA